MRFFIDKDLTYDLFEEKSGGKENFIDDWRTFSAQDPELAGQNRSLKTLYSWFSKGLPRNDDVFFSFFGALDADPIALTDLEKSKFKQEFPRLRISLLLGGLNLGGYRPLRRFFQMSPIWPDQVLAERFYRKRWSTFDFIHEAKEFKNSNVTVRISGDNDSPKGWPRAYHIAFRKQPNGDGLWRPYGTIITRGNTATLAQENGAMMEVDLAPQTQHQLAFKTHFGPRPADFRLISLHSFTAKVDYYDDPAVELEFAG